MTLLLLFLLDPFNKGFLFGYLLAGFIFLNIPVFKHLLDKDFVFLLMFSGIYTIIYSFKMEQGVQFMFIYLLFPATFYLIGKKIALKAKSQHELFFLFFILSFTFSISAVTSVILNLVEGGFLQTDRSIPMFWNGKSMKATAMGAFLTYNMTIPGLLLYYREKLGKFFMVFALIIFVATLFSVFRLGSRTQLVISFISIVVALFFIIPNQKKADNLKMIVSLTLIVGAFLLFFPIDLEADYFSVLGSRLEDSENAGSAGGRTERWSKSLQYMVSDPLGWRIEDFGYSHNFWFDVARYAGVLPCLLLLFITLRFYKKTFRAIRKNKNNLLLNGQILVYSIASFLIFFVEPIMEGLFFLFVSFCMFQGMIHGYLSHEQLHLQEESSPKQGSNS